MWLDMAYIKKDLESLGIEYRINYSPAEVALHRRAWSGGISIVFGTEEDRNYYRLVGEYNFLHLVIGGTIK